MTDAAAQATPGAQQVQIKVTVKERETEAYVSIVPPVAVDPQRVYDALAAEDIVFGLDDQAIQSAALMPPKTPVKVARGQLPEPGKNGRIEFAFGKTSSTPKEDESGRVDYRDLDVIQNVMIGAILATKVPPEEGVPGMTVRGAEIPAKKGKDVPLKAGQNAALTEDGAQVIALINGQPKTEGNRVSVLPLLEIKGDVDFSLGNVNFQGSVKIKGNVNPGFTVKVTQDVEIEGMVEGASIEASGRVTVKGGVRQHAVVIAHGDVLVRFVDSESSITTRGNIVVSENAMHATLSAGLAVRVGKKLIGGATQAGESIIAEQVGVPGGTKTVLDVRRARQKTVIEQLKRAIATLAAQLATVKQAYDTAAANPETPPAAIQKAEELRVQLEARMEQLTQELEERESGEFTINRPAFVASKTGFNPGVHLHFDFNYHPIETAMPETNVREVEGQLFFS